MISNLERIHRALESHRFTLANEEQCKIQMADVLTKHSFEFAREYALDKFNRLDFYLPMSGFIHPSSGIAIEVKLKESKKKIYRQCERYCKFDQVKGLLLVTNTTMGFPAEIHGKPCALLRLGMGWL